jgi:mannose-6-phosphate isomerase
MWYIAHAEPGAELYVGLKRGVTRHGFEHELRSGNVAECFHRVPVKAGDVMFLPSGRVHAIGSGLVIFEIQQNSDTTYRVFDWKRVGLDGKPRALHISESLASIDFGDFEPGLMSGEFRSDGGLRRKMLVKNPLFQTELVTSTSTTSETVPLAPKMMGIIAVVSGSVTATGSSISAKLDPGQFCLSPASTGTQLSVGPGSSFLFVQPGDSKANVEALKR